MNAFRRAILRLLYHGSARYCPLCERAFRRFRRYGKGAGRPDARCPGCGSLERHRLTWCFWKSRTDLFDGSAKTMLDIAPAAALSRKLATIPGLDYLTADLEPGRAMVVMDITDVRFPDASFDVIYCSHVLEHVPEDRKAMRELRRVLRAGGWALIAVPITVPSTIEDASVTSAEERLRRFGQKDHVRRYGPDIVERLQDTGFEVETIDAADIVSTDDVVRLGLQSDQPLYFCTRGTTARADRPLAS